MQAILSYGNIYYILMVILPIIFSVGFYFIFKKKKNKYKYIFIGILMGLNLLQHLLKNYVWPQYYGQEFGIIQTAYNMCALMIILNPLSLILKKCALKEALNLIGMFAGFAAIIIPYWFIDQNILTLEFLRYYVCHFLLASANLLCLLFDFNDIKIRNFYKIASHFILFKVCIFINNLVFHLIKGNTISQAYGLVKDANPIIMFKPIEVSFVKNLIDFFTPKIFIVDGEYVPFLYSMLGEFLLITVVSFIIELIYHSIKKRRIQNVKN